MDIFDLCLYVVVVCLLAKNLRDLYKGRKERKAKESAIADWKKTVRVENLITDRHLHRDAHASWAIERKVLLKLYLDACEELNIRAAADFSVMKEVLHNYPPYKDCGLRDRITFGKFRLEYTAKDHSGYRETTLTFDNDALSDENPVYGYNRSGSYYFRRT